jgi:hypothetical protein
VSPVALYFTLRRKFIKALNSLGRKTKVSRTKLLDVGDELDTIILEVTNSINRDSTREVAKEAFLCLMDFIEYIEQMEDCNKFVFKEPYTEDGELLVLENICIGLDHVAPILKEKGGFGNALIKYKLDELNYRFEGCQTFIDVSRTLWGDTTPDNSEPEDEDEDENRPNKRKRSAVA